MFSRLADMLFSKPQEGDPVGANPVDLCNAHSQMWPPQAAQHPLKWIRKEEKWKRERYPLVFVPASLSNGINGGLMGYERMFYWKQ